MQRGGLVLEPPYLHYNGAMQMFKGTEGPVPEAGYISMDPALPKVWLPQEFLLHSCS